ncbi:MAG: choice-of-anchor D domain-containing protein, partial [Phycisphaerae bacterium]|nr:choice-of-anchor D domain-containing protein [Phycisphaerae bacterium]
MMSSLISHFADSFRARRNGFARVIPAAAFALVAVLATPPAHATPEITVTQKSTALTDEGMFNIGNVRQDKSFKLTITINNDGDEPLTIPTATVAAPFQLELLPAASVAPGKRTTLRVVLPAGLTPGMISSLLTIENNDPNENPFNLTLKATITPVVPDANVLSGSIPVPSGGVVDLGSTETGIANSRKFTLENTGLADLVLSTPSIGGAGFTLEFPKTRVLRAGKRLNFTVRFTGTAAGDYDGFVTIPSNDPDEGSYEFDLLATLTPADARIRVFSQGTPLNNGDEIGFGPTRSDRSVDRVFTIRNEGRSNLVLGPVQVTGSG